VYYVDNPGDVVVEQQNEGIDEVRSTIDYTLPDWVNNLTLLGNATSGIGNAIDNVIVGNNQNDALIGDAGNDTLIGGQGVNSFYEGQFSGTTPGNDVIQGGPSGSDWLLYSTGSPQSGVIVDLAAHTATGGGAGGAGSASLSNIENVVGTNFDDVIRGDGSWNILQGGDGNDTISGGVGGVDQMWGGAGADSFVLDRTSASGALNIWVRDFISGEDKLDLDARVMPALGADGNFVANDPRFYAAPGATSGHDADDRVIYDTTNAALYYDPDGSGPAAAQTIAVFSSVTSAPPPSIQATDIVVDNGTPGAVINGTSGNDSLVGGAGNDTINGFDGNDTIDGGAGADSMVGGTGDDVYYVDNPGDAVVEQQNEGIDEVRSTIDYTLPDWVNNLTLLTGAVNGTGNAIDNVIMGNDVANSLSGGDGNDTLIGGGGDDTLDGGAGNDEIDGGSGNDLEIGGAGNDILGANDYNHSLFADADPGSDTLDGGLGDDTFFADATDTLIDEGGTDTVEVQGISWTLAAGFENLSFYNHDNDNGFHGLSGSGNDLDNTINALQGADGIVEHGLGGNDSLVGTFYSDTLDGGLGNDTLIGLGGGNSGLGAGDTYVFDVAPGAANADTIGGSVSNPALSDTLFVPGSDKIELDGNAYTNIGTSGNFATGDPRFFAGAGATSGHDADDRVVYDTSTGNLWYDADGSGAGAAQLIATLLGAPAISATDIEVINGGSGLVINGTAGDDSLVGTPGNDSINGLDGNDTIDGGAGADSMVGGNGDDVYYVDNPGDVVVEQQNAGIDEVRSTIDYTLPDWVNNLTLLSGAQVGQGNGIDNVVVGNGSMNVLWGHGGNDTLIGGGVTSGDTADEYIGGTGDDSMVGSSSADTFHLFLDGGSDYGHDTIVGGGGFDRLLADGPATTGIVVDLGAGTASGGLAAGSAVLSGIEMVVGSSLGDRITGDAGNNDLEGMDGNDTLNGAGGNDTLFGGAGADSFVFADAPGSGNADRIGDFASGTDRIHLDARVMTALGASGQFSATDARFFAGAGATAGHDADDRVIFNTTTGDLWYDADGSGTGTAQLIANLQTGTLVASDIMVDNGTSGGGTPPPPPPGSIAGTDGNDNLSGTAGNDTIYGQGGNDFVLGNAGNDSIVGGSGNDTIYGNDGNDWIEGTTGNDLLSGGSGQDSYVFREFGDANADTVANFSTQWDALQFDHNGFTAIGANGQFSATDARFYAAAGATGGHDADDRLVYNTSTGQLYYDADGSGSGAAQLVATFQGAPAVAANDIHVI
jgi:Ca2+-binding RTX toxin-like protein